MLHFIRYILYIHDVFLWFLSLTLFSIYWFVLCLLLILVLTCSFSTALRCILEHEFCIFLLCLNIGTWCYKLSSWNCLHTVSQILIYSLSVLSLVSKTLFLPWFLLQILVFFKSASFNLQVLEYFLFKNLVDFRFQSMTIW